MSPRNDFPPDDLEDIIEIYNTVLKEVSLGELIHFFMNLRNLIEDLDEASVAALGSQTDYVHLTNSCAITIVWEFVKINMKTIEKINAAQWEPVEDF